MLGASPPYPARQCPNDLDHRGDRAALFSLQITLVVELHDRVIQCLVPPENNIDVTLCGPSYVHRLTGHRVRPSAHRMVPPQGVRQTSEIDLIVPHRFGELVRPRQTVV